MIISINKEKGYIYGLLNGMNIKIPGKLQEGVLVNEINNIQYFDDKPVLSIVMDNYNKKNDLIRIINKRLGKKEFKMFYTLAKSFELLDSYKFNVNKSNLSFLRWIINISESADDKKSTDKIMERDLKRYSEEWLIYVLIHLIEMVTEKQKNAIMILNYITEDKKIIRDYSDEIANGIIVHIKDNKNIRNDLFKILNKLETLNGFYDVIDIINEEGLYLIKDEIVMEYILNNLENTKEFSWLWKLSKSPQYINPPKDLKSKIVTLILKEKTPKYNFEILNKLKKYNNRLYSNIMEDFIEIIAKNIDDNDKYIKLIIVLNYKCNDKDMANKIRQYEEENSDIIKSFIKVCDSSLLDDYYIKEIESFISNKDISNTIKTLEKIEGIETKRNCSILIVEELIENDIEKLADVWSYLSLGVPSMLKFKERIYNMFSNREIHLTKKTIAFLNRIGLESVMLYEYMDNEFHRNCLLNIWYESGENGKIIKVMKEEIINEASSLKDLRNISNLLKQYNINDHNMSILIKIRAYTVISIELLELNIESEKIFNSLDNLTDQLIDYDLVERFLIDEILQRELDKRIVDYIYKRFLNKVDSYNIWEYYWDNILSDLNDSRSILPRGKMEMFFTHLTKSKDRIEWFLDLVDNNINHEEYMNILEILLVLANKNNRIISQISHDKERTQYNTLKDIGISISKVLGNMEKAIVNGAVAKDGDVLIENMKKFRRVLKEIGIDTVEDIDNYGKMVKFDNTKHKNEKLINIEEGLVDSLGIKINNETIVLGTLLNVN